MSIITNIINTANGGSGIAKIEGKTVFVDYAVPGDIVAVEIYREHKNFSFASIKDIITPSELRIIPVCPNFSKCGGCDYLNIEYTTELKFKTQIIYELLRRISGLDTQTIPEIEIVYGERFRYRSHASIKNRNGKLGFFSRQSNNLIEFPATGCRLICESIFYCLKDEPLSIDSDFRISCDSENKVYISSGEEIDISESTGDFFYQHDINGFFQSNRYLRKEMIDVVLDYASPQKSEFFIDICCGCGFFTIPLAKFVSGGFGYDTNKISIDHAVLNSRLNCVDNLKFDVKSESQIHPFRLNPDFIVIDPPRSGISKNGRKTINAMSPERIVYISCDPSTFARDLYDFMKNGYSLNRITLIDMFPCTRHIEIITLLTKS